MADNVVANVGVGGATFATDDVTGIHYPLTKLAWGALDVANMVDDATGKRVPIKVAESTVTLTTDPTDRAARDLGKVDVALLDQYTPEDVDSGVGTVNAIPVILKTVAAGGAALGVAATPMRTDPTGTTTQPVSAASLPLPTGASTAAKQPALGTAGTPSADVLSVQGVAAMTALKVDGSAVTQPVSGTVTAAAQPGVDIGDVTINNTAGAAAVNVQDGGNSLTVDGTVAVSGTVTVDSELTTADLDTGVGTDTRAVVGLVRAESGGGVLVGSANPLPISGTVTANAGTGPFPVNDNAGSLTVDAPVGTPVNVRLSDGATNYDSTKTGQLPAALVGGRLDVNVGAVLASTKTIKRAVGSAPSVGDNTLIAAPGVSKVIKVISYALQGTGTVSAKATDGAAGTQLTMLWNFQAREGAYAQPTVIPQYHFKCTANTALVLNLSAAVAVGFEITYWDDDAS